LENLHGGSRDMRVVSASVPACVWEIIATLWLQVRRVIVQAKVVRRTWR